MRLSLFVVLSLLVMLPKVEAFGSTGHKAVAYQCEKLLTPKAKAQLKSILGNQSLADISVWPDQMRGSNRNNKFWKATGEWHYVNVPKNKGYASVRHRSQGDIVKAIEAFSDVLAGKRIKSGAIKNTLAIYFGDVDAPKNQKELRQFAVGFLIHLVGDIHQPLHAGYQADLGGNRVNVKWFGEKQNLHRVWDSSLLERQNLSPQALATKLSKMPKTSISRYQRSSLQGWLNESLKLRYRVYAVDKYNHTLSQAYVNEYTPVVNLQMQKAGVRAAALFNRLLK